MATLQHHSVRMAFAVLKSFYGANEWVSCAELSRRSRYPETSTDRTIKTLEELCVVVRDSRGRCRLHPYFTFLPQNGMPVVADESLKSENVIDLATVRNSRSATF